MNDWLTVQGLQLEGLDPEAPVLDRLAARGRLLAPSHPGFGHSPEAPSGRSPPPT
jgi:hypothetical protein